MLDRKPQARLQAELTEQNGGTRAVLVGVEGAAVSIIPSQLSKVMFLARTTPNACTQPCVCVSFREASIKQSEKVIQAEAGDLLKHR